MNSRTTVNAHGETVTRHLCTVIGCGWTVDEAGDVCAWHEDPDATVDLNDPDYDGPWDSRQVVADDA